MKAFASRLQGVFWTLVSLAVALIPLWLYVGIRSYAEPSGFWQELALGVVGLFFLGMIQLVLIVLWFLTLWVIWGSIEDGIPRRR